MEKINKWQQITGYVAPWAIVVIMGLNIHFGTRPEDVKKEVKKLQAQVLLIIERLGLLENEVDEEEGDILKSR